MSLSAHQITLVQTSFSKVSPIADTVASLFYSRLFKLDPSLESMFKGDIREQGRKLMQLLAFAVKSLDSLESLVPHVKALGQRHLNYGVSQAHYHTVGSALLWTLQQGLGEEFTPEVEGAWLTVYTLLVDVATEGIYEPEAV